MVNDRSTAPLRYDCACVRREASKARKTTSVWVEILVACGPTNTSHAGSSSCYHSSAECAMHVRLLMMATRKQGGSNLQLEFKYGTKPPKPPHA